MENICLRIKQVRKNWAMNQVEFAKQLGVTNAHISAIEKGKNLPSPALIKLISKEFKVNEQWLIDGTGPMDEEILEMHVEDTLSDAAERLNKVRTRNIVPIRARVAEIQKEFVNILDFAEESEEIQIKYLDICYKLFYHISSYLTYQKKALRDGQLNIFPFPDDLVANLEKDLNEFKNLFTSLFNE